jgi:hypothetical protein
MKKLKNNNYILLGIENRVHRGLGGVGKRRNFT